MSTYTGTSPLVIARLVGMSLKIDKARRNGKPVKALQNRMDRYIDEANRRENGRHQWNG